MGHTKMYGWKQVEPGLYTSPCRSYTITCILKKAHGNGGLFEVKRGDTIVCTRRSLRGCMTWWIETEKREAKRIIGRVEIL